MTVRLIHRTDVLQQLLAAIAEVPRGQKLSIPALRDRLISQGDVIHGIEKLIAALELDPATLRPCSGQALRPPEKSAPKPIAEAPAAASIIEEIKAFCARTGMAPSRFGKEAVNDFGLVARLERRKPTEKTIARIRAYIEQKPAVE